MERTIPALLGLHVLISLKQPNTLMTNTLFSVPNEMKQGHEKKSLKQW